VDKVFLTGVLVIALTGVLLPVVNRIFRVSGIPGVAIASAGYLISAMFILSSEEGDILKNFFVSDGVSRFVGALILLSSWLTMLVIYAIKEKDRFVNELIAGLLLSTAGALLLISSNNFLSLVISMELMTMPTYLMVLFVMTKPSIEAGIKYFFSGAFAVGTLLFGVSLLYGISGSLDFSAVSTALNGDFLGIIALIFVLAGFGFKMTAFPFHFWGPDVYDGTCPGVASILTGILKSAVFIAFMRVVYEVFSKSFTKELTVLFAIISAITMTLGNLLALAQKRVSRILAYSSVAHAGYTLVAFSALSVPISTAGIVYHSIAYVFMKTSAFLAFAGLLYLWGVSTMDEYKGLGRKEPLLSALFLVFLFSLAGIPPLAGFMSKVFVFLSAVKAKLLWLALLGLLNSAFSVAYYIWIAKQMYLEDPVVEHTPKKGNRKLILLSLAVSAITLVVFGIWINPILEVSAEFVSSQLGR